MTKTEVHDQCDTNTFKCKVCMYRFINKQKRTWSISKPNKVMLRFVSYLSVLLILSIPNNVHSFKTLTQPRTMLNLTSKRSSKSNDLRYRQCKWPPRNSVRECLLSRSDMSEYDDKLRSHEERSQTNSSKNKSKKPLSRGRNLRNDFPGKATMDTSLCIIPPDSVWDDIQRARHFARDPTFYQWPPAIRLFHPFVQKSNLPDVAISIAELIEKYELSSFDVTFDQLRIVPNYESIQELEDAQSLLPQQSSSIKSKYESDEGHDDDDNIKRLIALEEMKGRERLEKKLAKQREEQISAKDESKEGKKSNKRNKIKLTPDEVYREQLQKRRSFDGPCVICLEPDDESKLQIMAFREILRKKLFNDYDPFSVSSPISSSISSHGDTAANSLPRIILQQHGIVPNGKKKLGKLSKKKMEGSTFRPVITLGQFSSVTKAKEIAHKLHHSWEPLTFRVTDLHLVSRMSSATNRIDAYDYEHDVEFNDEEKSSSTDIGSGYDKNGIHILAGNRELALRRKVHSNFESEAIFDGDREYGCDAMIMLYNEEHHLIATPPSSNDKDILSHPDYDKDDEGTFHLSLKDEAEIMKLLMSNAANDGGIEQHEGSNPNEGNERDFETEEDEEGEDRGDIENWLNEDDECDEGATIIIGRTQFFMGEMRQYVGMPATSTKDGKDKVLGDGRSGISRRRGAVHRGGSRWNDGDFGQKEKDYLT